MRTGLERRFRVIGALASARLKRDRDLTVVGVLKWLLEPILFCGADPSPVSRGRRPHHPRTAPAWSRAQRGRCRCRRSDRRVPRGRLPRGAGLDLGEARSAPVRGARGRLGRDERTSPYPLERRRVLRDVLLAAARAPAGGRLLARRGRARVVLRSRSPSRHRPVRRTDAGLRGHGHGSAPERCRGGDLLFAGDPDRPHGSHARACRPTSPVPARARSRTVRTAVLGPRVDPEVRDRGPPRRAPLLRALAPHVRVARRRRRPPTTPASRADDGRLRAREPFRVAVGP